MAAQAARTLLDLDAAEGALELVVDDDEARGAAVGVRGEAVAESLPRGFEGASADVHQRGGLPQGEVRPAR